MPRLHPMPICLTAALLATACAPRDARGPALAPNAAVRLDTGSLALYDGDGTPRTWSDLMNAVGNADVIFAGELHDDATGHAVQLALVEDTLDRWPDAALSLEMLERDEQDVLDDYLDGIIDEKALETLTSSTNWGGPGRWSIWYQPIIQTARDRDARVVAANAPRRYVRLARLEGAERLDALPPERRRFVEHADIESIDEAYRQRFDEQLSGPGHGDEPMDQEMLDSMFVSQLVWDATMAGSIDDALGGGASRVVHLVGRFHCDFDGGTVQELRRRRPGVRVVVLSMQRGEAWSDDDRGRADFVLYTGR